MSGTMIEIISTTAAMNATSDYPFDDIFPDDDETTTAGNGTSLVVNWMVKFIPSILLYSVIFIVGFVGNIVVILSICYLKKLHTITNMFIVSLSLADLLLIIICVPIKMIEFFTNQWIFGPFLCKLFHYMQFFTSICSILNLSFMGLERYMAILHPFKARYTCTRKRAKLMILFTWIGSFLLALPIIYGKEVVKIGLHKDVDVCVRVWCPTCWKIFEIYRSTIILFIPFFIMLFTYTRICLVMWKMPAVRHQVQCVNANVDDAGTRNQIIKMLICLVVIFFVSWAPIILNNLLVSFDILSNMNTGILWYLRLAFYALSYINSCFNPIVYALMSMKFREAYKNLFNKMFGNIGKSKTHMSSSLNVSQPIASHSQVPHQQLVQRNVNETPRSSRKREESDTVDDAKHEQEEQVEIEHEVEAVDERLDADVNEREPLNRQQQQQQQQQQQHTQRSDEDNE